MDKAVIIDDQYYSSLTVAGEKLNMNRNKLSALAKNKKVSNVKFANREVTASGSVRKDKNFALRFKIPNHVFEFIDQKTNLYLDEHASRTRSFHFYFTHPKVYVSGKELQYGIDIPYNGFQQLYQDLKKLFDNNPRLYEEYHKRNLMLSPTRLKKEYLQKNSCFRQMPHTEVLTHFGDKKFKSGDPIPVKVNQVIFVSATQAANVLGITRKTLQSWCQNDSIPNWNYVSIENYKELLSMVE